MNNLISDQATKASMDFAMEALSRIPKDDKEALEAHITGMLIVFWGALWGTFGTEYARGFVEAQLNGMRDGMRDGMPHERFTQPTVQ